MKRVVERHLGRRAVEPGEFMCPELYLFPLPLLSETFYYTTTVPDKKAKKRATDPRSEELKYAALSEYVHSVACVCVYNKNSVNVVLSQQSDGCQQAVISVNAHRRPLSDA